MPAWFDQEVSELERRNSRRRGEKDLVLFYGSSSFTLWRDIERFFPGFNVVNNGFGGSTLEDCVEYFDRLVGAFAPRVVLVYAGDNDLGNGSTPEAVLDRLQRLLERKRATLGDTPLAFVSIKVSPARFGIMHAIAYTNLILERHLGGLADASFVDITRVMVGRGLPGLLDFYSEDSLHMNRNGYSLLGKALWGYLLDCERRNGPLRTAGPAAHPAWMDSPG